MKPLHICLVLAGLFLQATTAHAQLMFDTNLDTYLHPKSEWERWSSTKAGDFVEFSEGQRVFARFEAVNAGDHEMSVRTTTFQHHPNHLGHIPSPSTKVIKHVFKLADRKSVQPTKVTDDALKLGDQEISTKLEEFAYQKRVVKKIWRSDAAPFDGMLKYQPYSIGKPGVARMVSKFKKGEKAFGE